ncbi:MAG: phage Gp37/Gp68 family protein [Prevotella sp.]|nr:phage Gp37/Gp68 family protein [Prevotella sp.]
MTKIEWTEKTWNPVTGCTKISEACENCYAEVMAKRLSGMPASKEKYRNGFKLTIHPKALKEPYEWKKPCMVFVCSMGDLFHKDVPTSFIDRVMRVIEDNSQHTFQILTKRASRMFGYFFNNRLPKNAWIGTTCENKKHYDRIAYLRAIHGATVRFISCEPLLGNMNDIDLDGIDWVITGGESGVNARRTPADWFRGLRDACRRWNTPFFFKQWGAWGEDGVKRSKYENGSLLDGREWKEYPRIIATL